MEKKTRLSIIIAIILIIIAAVMFFIFSKTKQILPQAPAIPKPASEFSIPSPADEKMPVKTSTGGTVNLNNVYRNSVENLSQNGVAFKDKSDYYMAYYPQNQGFLIVIRNPDIKSARGKAEADFLQTLDIDKTTACQLNISLSVPYSVNPAASGKEYGLSFCPDGMPLPK